MHSWSRTRQGVTRPHYTPVNPRDGSLHAHQHMRTGPCINVSVEQLDYRPVALTRIRSLARALVVGESPPGATTPERIEAIEAC